VLRSILVVCTFLALPLAAHLSLAQEFSADIMNLKSGNESNETKVYVGDGKFRFESRERKGGPGVFIIDEAQNKRFVLMPEQHMYMDLGQLQMFPIAYNFWRPPDANDACAQWKKMAEQIKRSKFGTCHKVGSDTVNGRSAIKYEGTSTDGETSHVWVDTKLRYVTKVETATGVMEMRNIQEGAQPASLFEIPAGYTKMDMGSMMQQRQH
jgi:hypothetical protein